MTLVGIPIIFTLICVFEISRGMWIYHTLAYAVNDAAARRIVWEYFGHMRAWDAMRRYIRLDLDMPGFRGIIATRVLAVSPETTVVARHEARLPFADRSAKWLE